MPKPKPSAIPLRTEPARVASPTVPGAVEDVRRSIDTLTSMARRRQITDREAAAGLRYRTAYDTIYGQMGGVMDFDRSRGGGTPGQPFGVAYLHAAEQVSDVKRWLYPQDYTMVHRVCALGHTLEDCAGLFSGSPGEARREAGRRLRAGLEQLADRWFPAGPPARMRAVRMDRAEATEASVVDVGGVYVGARLTKRGG